MKSILTSLNELKSDITPDAIKIAPPFWDEASDWIKEKRDKESSNKPDYMEVKQSNNTTDNNPRNSTLNLQQPSVWEKTKDWIKERQAKVAQDNAAHDVENKYKADQKESSRQANRDNENEQSREKNKSFDHNKDYSEKNPNYALIQRLKAASQTPVNKPDLAKEMLRMPDWFNNSTVVKEAKAKVEQKTPAGIAKEQSNEMERERNRANHKNPTDNTKPTSFSSPDPNKGSDGELTWKQRLSNSMSDVGHKISDNSGKIAGASALAAAGGLGYLAYKKLKARSAAKK